MSINGGESVPDVTAVDHGSIWIVTPHSDEAKAWVDDNVSTERTSWGSGIAVDHRMVEPLLSGMMGDGLRVVFA